MTENKTSEAQLKASKKWKEEHKQHNQYINLRSNARSFIRNRANEADLAELENLIAERRKTLRK